MKKYTFLRRVTVSTSELTNTVLIRGTIFRTLLLASFSMVLVLLFSTLAFKSNPTYAVFPDKTTVDLFTPEIVSIDLATRLLSEVFMVAGFCEGV